MIKNQIEINANFKSTAASWLGVDVAALKTDKNADLDDIQQNECLFNSKVQTTLSPHHSKTNRKSGPDPADTTALFVGGKLHRKLEKAKRRKDINKYVTVSDNQTSSVRQEEYFEEDSKMSVVQSKSKTLANPQRGDLQTSAVESLKQLLAETKDKNKKKKLRKKLKKLQEKSSESVSSENDTSSHTASETPVTNESDKKKKKLDIWISDIFECSSKTDSKNIGHTLGKSSKTFKETHVENDMKKGNNKKKKHIPAVLDGQEKCCNSSNFDSGEGQIPPRLDGQIVKRESLFEKSSSAIEDGGSQKVKKKKKVGNRDITEVCFETISLKTKLKIDFVEAKGNVVAKLEKKEGVNIIDLSEEVNDEDLKRKQTASDDDDKDGASLVKQKKGDTSVSQTSQMMMDSELGDGLTEKHHEEESSNDQPFKRKRKKKRSKQKNIKKDHRPDNMKPPHLRTKSSSTVQSTEH